MQWQLDIEKTHRDAGFEAIDESLIRRRYWHFIDFLQRNSFTISTLASSVEDIFPAAELRNSHLTDAGYAFAQRYADSWLERMYKDQGSEKEELFLQKWLQKLTDEPKSA